MYLVLQLLELKLVLLLVLHYLCLQALDLVLQLDALLVKRVDLGLKVADYLVFVAQRLLVEFALFASLRVEFF